MSPSLVWLHTSVSFHTETYFVAEGTATDTTDGSDTNGPTRNPPHQTSGHPAHVSPAIPAVVVIFSLLAVVIGAWWLLRRLRRSQMNHVTLLEMIGLVRKPHLFDVGITKPQVLRTAGEGDWHMLTVSSDSVPSISCYKVSFYADCGSTAQLGSGQPPHCESFYRATATAVLTAVASSANRA
ncbi:hypothetical protein NUW54_g10418 [Trametes sanguinea]|uniref:Uncharacterized protein n=1 Tax=Trametes sanguinea TaxID=158606 RepID=A0ACC1P1R4_9APHY|nr:hypothetical protein NUW54_g10418 [Trametes sanguinea]